MSYYPRWPTKKIYLFGNNFDKPAFQIICGHILHIANIYKNPTHLEIRVPIGYQVGSIIEHFHYIEN